MSTLEDAERWEYEQALVDNERDRQRNGTGMVDVVRDDWIEEDE